MAKHFSLIQVGTPTGLTPVLQAGGGLSAGTAYYYRVIAVRYYGSKAIALSAPCAEASETPDAVNKTIALSWSAVANANAYIIQRTIASGSYPPDGTNSFTLNGRSYSTNAYATTLTSLTDDGGAVSRVRFTGANMDFSQEFPVLEAYGDSTSDIITLSDLLDEATFAGFIDLIAPADLRACGNANWREEAPYIIYGGTYIRNCTFRLRGMLIAYGQVRINTDAKVEAGDKTYYYSPYIFTLCPFAIPYTNDNDSYNGVYPFTHSLGCAADSFARNLIRRPLNTKNTGYAGLFNYGSVYDSGIPANLELLDSIAGMNSMNAMDFYGVAAGNNIFESLRHEAPVLQDSLIRFANECLCYRYASNQRAVRCKTLYGAYDLSWGLKCGGVEIDCAFQAKGQADNQPYYACQCNAAGNVGHSLLRQNSFKVKATDPEGNPVNGAAVVLEDALGNPDMWEDSGATFSTALNSTDSSSSLTVSDGTKFSLNDVIRLETYGERLLVTNIAGNVLTVARGYGGTAKRATETGNSNRALKQVSSLITGADGIAEWTEAVTAKELAIARSDGGYYQAGYEDALVSAGWISRIMRTPHTLTITKEPYQEYVSVITVDRKMDLEVGLKGTIEQWPHCPVEKALESAEYGNPEDPLVGVYHEPEVDEVAAGVWFGPHSSYEGTHVDPPVYVPVPSGEMDIILSAPELLEVALESEEIKVELREG